ncbi:MAG: Hpt domain-containing protein [Roseobacter sp.]
MTPEIIKRETYDVLCDTMGAEFVAELVTTFLDDAPNMFAALKTAVGAQDIDAYRRAAHSIKSNAEIFGAVALAEQARDMELSGLPEGAAPIPALETVFADTEAALRPLLDA